MKYLSSLCNLTEALEDGKANDANDANDAKANDANAASQSRRRAHAPSQRFAVEAKRCA